MAASRDRDIRYAPLRQYSLAQILAVWAGAALPMEVLAWVVAPWLTDQLGAADPFAQALLICITAGLIWQFLLILILLRRELGGLKRSRVRDALWLRPPRDPNTGRVGGRVWWWVLPLFLLFAVVQFVGDPPVPAKRSHPVRLSLTAVRERVDGHHRPRRSERHGHRPHPHPRARLDLPKTEGSCEQGLTWDAEFGRRTWWP